VFSYESHIHSSNIARGLLVEIKIWFSPIYGQVVHGSTSLHWIFHILIISLLLFCSLWKCTCYYVALMFFYHCFSTSSMLVVSMVL